MTAYMLFQWVNGGLHISFLFALLIVWLILTLMAFAGRGVTKPGDQHFHNHFADEPERKVDESQV